MELFVFITTLEFSCRFGALWLGGLELLRTTTPEPTAAGIQWSIEKDVTVYSSYFLTPNLTAYLAIPNNVDNTYTGVIHISATLTFYSADSDGVFPPQSLPFVFPLTKASENRFSNYISNFSTLRKV